MGGGERQLAVAWLSDIKSERSYSNALKDVLPAKASALTLGAITSKARD